MSRFYEMSIEITGYDKAREKQVQEAATGQWKDFMGEWYNDSIGVGDDRKPMMGATAQGYLYGGESESQFTNRIAKAIWTANHGPCDLRVKATCLDELPYEAYSLSEDDYERMMGPISPKTACYDGQGLHYKSDAWADLCDRAEWDGYWPEIDGNGRLTGRVVGSEEGYLNATDAAMISIEAAREGGWIVDIEAGRAFPPIEQLIA